MMQEYIDIFDENNQPTGIIKEKDEAHRLGLYHRTAHTWLINRKKELLLQLRSKHKSNFPNYWDISSAGHLRAGETYSQGAIRELREELGVDVLEKELIPVTVVSYFAAYNREFAQVFLLQTALKEEDFCFSDGEVEAVKYVNYKKLAELLDDPANRILSHGDEEKILFDFIVNNLK